MLLGRNYKIIMRDEKMNFNEPRKSKNRIVPFSMVSNQTAVAEGQSISAI
jgi:hypothetical protein